MAESCSKKLKLTPWEQDIIDIIIDHNKIKGASQLVEERKEGGELNTGKEQQSGRPQKERALRFANDEAFLKAVTHLWRKQPFELGGWHCLIVPDNVANDLLTDFTGEEVKEIELVDLADLPEEEALRRYAARFKK